MLDIQRIVQLMQTHQVARQRDLVGVCLTEIQALQQRLGVVFPASYCQFLHICGRSAGLLSPWVALYFDDLLEIRDEFHLHLDALTAPIDLSPELLVIAQAEAVFDFIYCDGSDDPPVYRINFQTEQSFFSCNAPAFSLYLESLVEASDRANWLDDLTTDETYAVTGVGDEDKLL